MLRNPFKKKLDPATEALITSVLIEMNEVGVIAPEYPALLAYLERLHELRAKQRREPMSRDTAALIAGNLAGILLIVAYEQKHVMTSKGFTQIIRPK